MLQEAQEGPQGALAAPEGGNASADNADALESNSSPDSFSRAYVEQLRAEAKEARQKAQRMDYLATEVRRLAIKEATRGILADPEALVWSDKYETEDGLPNHDRLRVAAEALATVRPWLSRPRGDVGQGQHGDVDQALSLSELLRSS